MKAIARTGKSKANEDDNLIEASFDTFDFSALWATAVIEAGSPVVELTNDIDDEVLLLLAESPAATARVLASLAFNLSVEIRQAVADNPSTPFLTLLMLVGDESADVRFRLAENYDLPNRLLQLLAEDENPYVSCRAQHTLNRKHEREMAA